MAGERKDVSSLDSGVPLLFVKTKREEDKGRKGGKKKEHEGTEERGRDRGRERESRKLEPVTDNNEVCSVTET